MSKKQFIFAIACAGIMASSAVYAQDAGGQAGGQTGTTSPGVVGGTTSPGVVGGTTSPGDSNAAPAAGTPNNGNGKTTIKKDQPRAQMMTHTKKMHQARIGKRPVRNSQTMGGNLPAH